MNRENSNSPADLGKKFSIPLSIWHWSNLLAIVAILITVFLVKTIFSSKENYPLIQTALEKKGTSINIEQAKAVAKIYTHKLWDWHVYFGYVLSGLFLFRIIIEFYQLADEKFLWILKRSRQAVKEQSDSVKHSKHVMIVRYIYLLFYIDLALMVVTGLFIEFSDNYPNLKPIRSTVKDVHNFGMYVMLAFISIHLLGLLVQNLKEIKEKTS